MREPYLGDIPIGDKVSTPLYGRGVGYVYEVVGKPDPDSVRQIGPIGVTGGKAHYKIVFCGGQRATLPESLLRASVQWQIHPGERASRAELRALLDNAEQLERNEAARQEREQKAFDAEVGRLREAPEYAALVRAKGSDMSVTRLAAKNLRRLLKQTFPGVQFSVRMSSHNAIDIRWTDGPVSDEVKAVTQLFEAGHFDGMDDSYHYRKTPFSTVFGSAMYVFPQREYSDELIRSAIDAVFERYAGNLTGVEKPSVEDYRQGRTATLSVPHIGETLDVLIRLQAHATPGNQAPKKAKLPAKGASGPER